jgi:iron complex transport system ATP-binding protein
MSLVAKNIEISFSRGKSTMILHEAISIQVNDKDICLLAGANGVGKSLLLKTLIGINPLLNGEILIDGEKYTNNKPQPGLISYLSAASPSVELMSVLEVVLSAQRNQSWFGKETELIIQKAKSELNFCGVKHLSEASFVKLSDGEKQKVMLARSLFQNTKYVLLDEPTAFLDYPSKVEFWELIRKRSEMNNQGFLVCSHDLHVALPRVDRMYLLRKDGMEEYPNPRDFNPNEWDGQ